MKSEELRSGLRADVGNLSKFRKLQPVQRIPKKTRTTGEVQDKKRSFSTMTKQQVEPIQRANLVEEAAARELLSQKTSLSKTTKVQEETSPVLASNVQGLTRMIPALSARELKQLAATIKRRRLQLVRPATPKPRERLQPLLERTQRARSEAQPATESNRIPVTPRPANQPQQLEVEDDEEELLRRLLCTRRLAANRSAEAKAAQPVVPQLADTLVASSLRPVIL